MLYWALLDRQPREKSVQGINGSGTQKILMVFAASLNDHGNLYKGTPRCPEIGP